MKFYIIGWVNCSLGHSAYFGKEREALKQWYLNKRGKPPPGYKHGSIFLMGKPHEYGGKLFSVGVIPNINLDLEDVGLMLKGMYEPLALLKRLGNYINAEQRRDFVELFCNNRCGNIAVQLRHYAYA